MVFLLPYGDAKTEPNKSNVPNRRSIFGPDCFHLKSEQTGGFTLLEPQKFPLMCQTRRSAAAKCAFRTDEGFIDQGGFSVQAPDRAESTRQERREA